MTLRAVLRTYERLATLPARLEREQRADEERELNVKAEELLMEFLTRFLVAYGSVDKQPKPVEPMSMCTNMTYDPGPRREERRGARRLRPR
jgi:hypothetical protein